MNWRGRTRVLLLILMSLPCPSGRLATTLCAQDDLDVFSDAQLPTLDEDDSALPPAEELPPAESIELPPGDDPAVEDLPMTVPPPGSGIHLEISSDSPPDELPPANDAVLADEGRRVELAVPVKRLARIAAQLASDEGIAKANVELSREAGQIIAALEFEAGLTLRCQRCLGPMPQRLQGSSRVALVESEAAVAEVPPELETALAPAGRMALAELVEEELMLALPAAPRHAEGECPAARPEARENEAPEVQRPFANLGELLGNRSKH